MIKKILFITIGFVLLGSVIFTLFYINNPPPEAIPETVSPSSTPDIVTTIEPETQEITILSLPQGTNVIIDGQIAGITPFKYKFTKNKEYKINAAKEGYLPLLLNYKPTGESLRLQLVAVASIPSVTSVPVTTPPLFTPTANSTEKPTITPTPAIFPTPPDLRIVSRTDASFYYTAKPASPSAQGSVTTSATPRVLPPSVVNTQTPSAEQVTEYLALISSYSGVHNFPEGDLVDEGTADEQGIIIADNWFYPDKTIAFVAYPLRFINTGSTACTLYVNSTQGNILVGTIQKNESLLFTAENGVNEIMRFSCKGHPQVSIDIDVFS